MSYLYTFSNFSINHMSLKKLFFSNIKLCPSLIPEFEKKIYFLMTPHCENKDCMKFLFKMKHPSIVLCGLSLYELLMLVCDKSSRNTTASLQFHLHLTDCVE